MIEWKDIRHVDDDGALRYLATVAGVLDVEISRPAHISSGYEVLINYRRVKGPLSATPEEAKTLAAATLISLCRKALREIGARP